MAGGDVKTIVRRNDGTRIPNADGSNPEFGGFSTDARGFLHVNGMVLTRNGNGHAVAVGAASAQGTAMPANTTSVRLIADVACWVNISSNPTAVANTSFYLPANVPTILSCVAADKVAVLQTATAGNLYVQPLL